MKFDGKFLLSPAIFYVSGAPLSTTYGTTYDLRRPQHHSETFGLELEKENVRVLAVPRTSCNTALREHESQDAGEGDGLARHYRSRNAATFRQTKEGWRPRQVTGLRGNAGGPLPA